MNLSTKFLQPKPENRVIRALTQNAVPIFFLTICALGIWAADMNLAFLTNELMSRFTRNAFLVLSLIIPVTAGMGLNFGIVIGAMAGQLAVIAVAFMGIPGLNGFLLAVLFSTPLAIFFGYLAGLILNRAKGREMITSMILGFFANGIYQLIVLFLIGTVIPIHDRRLMLPSGVGLRNTVDLYDMKGALSDIWKVQIDIIGIPIMTILVIAGLCVVINFFMKTTLGHKIRAVGQDMHIAEVAGLNVNKVRITAMILSTVLAAWGQLIFLQDITTLNTYESHQQVGTFAVAALLVGGASAKRATIWQGIVGVLLFHMLFYVSPIAGQKLAGNAQIGEYFRTFIAYGVIGIALALHAWKTKKL